MSSLPTHPVESRCGREPIMLGVVMLTVVSQQRQWLHTTIAQQQYLALVVTNVFFVTSVTHKINLIASPIPFLLTGEG